MQGALEIGDLTAFSDQQIMLIRRRLNDVKERTPYISTIWLTLALADPVTAFEEIKKLQYDIFVHDIDPTYDGDQDQFMAIHNGEAML